MRKFKLYGPKIHLLLGPVVFDVIYLCAYSVKWLIWGIIVKILYKYSIYMLLLLLLTLFPCNMCEQTTSQKIYNNLKNIKLLEFDDYIWNHHEKYI